EAASDRAPGSPFFKVGDLAPKLPAVSNARQCRGRGRSAGPRLAVLVLAFLVTLRSIYAMQANVDRALACADQPAISVVSRALPGDDWAFRTLSCGHRYRLGGRDSEDNGHEHLDRSGHGRLPLYLSRPQRVETVYCYHFAARAVCASRGIVISRAT